MAFPFIDFPAELRTKIFGHCKKKDLATLAILNRNFYDEVRPHIWADVKIFWHTLRVPNNIGKSKHLQLTRKMKIACPVYLREDKRLKQGYASFSFSNILNSLDPAKLKTLSFGDFLVADGLHLVSVNMPLITSLHLKRITAVGESWSHICDFTRLTELVVHDCNVKDDHFGNISDCHSLKVLRISGCEDMGGASLMHINKIANGLVSFEFSGYPIASESQYSTHLTNLNSVEILSLQRTGVGDSFFLHYWGKLKHLSVLDIRSTINITSLGFESISTFSSLTEIDLDMCFQIEDRDLKHIGKLALLRTLVLSACEEITDEGIIHLSNLKSLQNLDISYCGLITDHGIEQSVTKMTSLRKLNLLGCDNLTDSSLELISRRLLELVHIDADCKLFTVSGLDHLLTLPNLASVHYRDGITDDEDWDDFQSRLTSKFAKNEFS